MGSASIKPWKQAMLLDWWLVIAGIAILFIPSYYRLANGLWNSDGLEAHGPTILAVVLWMFWRSRQSLKDIQESSWPVLGACILGLGLLCYVVGRSQKIPVFEVGSQVPILIGLILTLRGARTLKLLWFPLVFMLFLVPLPGFILDSLTGPLKYMVSNVVEGVLFAFGYPISRSGVVLYIGQYQLLVADACSGLNSMYTLSALGLLYVHLTRHEKKWRIALLLLSIIPIAIFSNMLRVTGLVLLTYYLGDDVGQGFFHEFSGILLFAFSILLLAGLDKLLSIKDRKPRREALSAPH